MTHGLRTCCRGVEDLFHLSRHPGDECLGLDILSHDAPGGRHRAITNRDRSYKHRVRADLYPVANVSLVLVLPVVIAGDRPGTDIRVLPDGGVAEVGEVACL